MILLNDKNISSYITCFPDGTRQLWKIYGGDSPQIKAANDIVWLYERDDEIFILAQLCGILRSYEITQTIQLRVPFLPYGRQDKEVSNEATFGLHTLAQFLNTLPVNTIVTRDVHSKVSRELIYRLIDYPIDYTEILKNNYDYVLFPDKGAFERYRSCFPKQNYLVAEKVREQSSGKITKIQIDRSHGSGMVWDNHRDAKILVVDDICDGGATFIKLYDDVLEKNCGEVHLCVTHGIFSKGFTELSKRFSKIYTTNSLAQYYEYKDEIVHYNNCQQSSWFREFYKCLNFVGSIEVMEVW